MTDAKHESEWISALAAVHLISPKVGGDHTAKAILISRMVDGVFEGRAEVKLQEADLGDLDIEEPIERSPRYYPRQRETRYIEVAGSADGALLMVPADFFQFDGKGWVLAPEFTSWREGLFLSRRPATFRRPINSKFKIIGDATPPNLTAEMSIQSDAFIRRACVGLRFRKAEIEAIITGSEATTTAVGKRDEKLATEPPITERPTTAKGKGGRPRSTLWEDWVAELVAMIYEEGYTPPTTTSQLRAAVEIRLHDRGLKAPGEDMVQRALSAVINRLGSNLQED